MTDTLTDDGRMDAQKNNVALAGSDVASLVEFCSGI